MANGIKPRKLTFCGFNWRSQDGATCRTSGLTMDLLQEKFSERVISKNGDVGSFDLTTLDFFSGAKLRRWFMATLSENTFFVRFFRTYKVSTYLCVMFYLYILLGCLIFWLQHFFCCHNFTSQFALPLFKIYISTSLFICNYTFV